MTDTRQDERDPDLAIAESPRFQRQEWIAERVAWLLALVVLAAAVLGLFANGPLAQGTASAGDGRLTVDYQRYARDGGTTSLRVQVAPEAVDRNLVELRVSAEYLDAVAIQQAIVPEPAAWVEDRDGVVFHFEAEAGAPFQATFTVHPNDVGSQRGAVALVGDAPAEFTQFFYP